MTSRPTFNLRLRAYTPLGAPAGIIPDLGLTVVSGPDGATLTAVVSTVVYGALPDDLEVAVEVWSDSLGAWLEGRDCRFVANGQQGDDRDVTGLVTLTGLGLPQWLAGKAALAGVTPYSDAGNVEAAASGTGIHLTGKTFTWQSNILGEGDRIRITNSGKAKGLSTGSVYFVRNPTGATFQVSHTVNGAIQSFGSSTAVGVERVRTRIVNLNGSQFAKNEAISVWDANANQALTNGSQYYVVNPTATTIQVATKPGGIPIELVADSLIVYRYLDGARQFKNQTAGQIIGTAFAEAVGRGWGCDASGTPQVTASWSNAGDSNSLAWPARVDDPTITGVSVGFQPGTSMWDQIRFMLDGGWAEFASQGRTFQLFAPLTGTDYGTTANQRRLGAAAQQVVVTKDLTDYRTAETVRGEGPIENTVVNPRSPWGRLEVYTTASGVSSSKQATSSGRNDLATYAGPAIGYQVVEAAQEAAYLPILDYQRGDWVMVQVKGVWTRLRVTQWTMQKNTDGTATVTVLLAAKKRSLGHKIAGAAKKANGGRAATTSSTTPVESDKRKAAVPSSLTVSARTVHMADASTKSTVTAVWSPVTVDEDGDNITGAAYEVIVRQQGEQDGKTVATTKGNQADLAGYSAGQTIAVSVRAQSSTGEWGELTGEVEYVVDGVEALPITPSTPVVVSVLGSVTASWDGMLVDPIDGPIRPPNGFAHLQVQRSADGGVTWTIEAQTLNSAGTVTDLGLVVGASYSYRFVAVDSLGNPSVPSDIATCSVVGIDVSQINAGFKNAMDQVAAISQNAQEIAEQTAATAGSALGAASSAQTTASNALTSANGKSKITYSTSSISGAGINVGDLWFQVNPAGQIIGQWTWDGGNWQSNQITGQVVTDLDAGSITTGYLSAERIAARSISADQLAVADFTNLFPSPHFDSVGGGTWFSTGLYGGSDVPIGSAIQTSQRDTVSTFAFPVKAGDSFYIEVTLKAVAGAAACVPTLWISTASGSSGNGWQGYSLLGATEFAGTIANYPGGWARYGYKVTIPTAWSDVAFAAAYLQINETDGSTTIAMADLLIRRAMNAQLIVDGSVTALSIAAGAIDGKTITGATIQTASTAATSGGVILNSSGIIGYNSSGSATFLVDNAGDVSMTGTVNATAGTISGVLTLGPAGSLTTSTTSFPRTELTASGLKASRDSTTYALISGAVPYSDHTAPGIEVATGASASRVGSLAWDNTGGGELFASSQLYLNTSQIVAPIVYATSVSGRSVTVRSDGTLGYASSSRRTKNLHSHVRMDDATLDVWLKLPAWSYDYRNDPEHRVQYGMVAEEVYEAGLEHLVYFDERDGDTKGQIDGLAYERMPVMNKMAISRLYERLIAAEKKIARMEATR